MKTSGLTELEAVLSVARHRSFRAAANELSVSTSALSHAIAALEARIGVRLFNRTTRSVSLSEAGAQFVQNIAPALSTIRDALEQAGSFRDTPSGTLRINTSVGAAHQAMPLFIAFLKRYPDMKLDIVTEGRLIDVVVEGFDAGIRLLETVPQDMIAVPFGDRQRFAVVGSPAYFEQHKPPRTPADLATHRCIRSRMPSGSIYQWEFERHGESIRIDGDGALTLDERHDADRRARGDRSRLPDRMECRRGSRSRRPRARARRLDAAARRTMPLLSRPSSCAGGLARIDGHDPRICRRKSKAPGAEKEASKGQFKDLTPPSVSAF